MADFHRLGSSSQDFFASHERNPPTRFRDTNQWVSARTFLFCFGLLHANKRKLERRNIVFTDQRAVLYDMGKVKRNTHTHTHTHTHTQTNVHTR